MRVEERLLKYVSYWTTSESNEEGRIPSSDREWALGEALKEELEELGLKKVTLSENCYVYGLLPATPGMENKKAVGLIAHIDTSSSYPGKDVKPQIIKNYDGGDVLLAGNGLVLKTDDFPHLKEMKGRTLITTDGTTLLGADDKAGVAEIITAVEQIMEEKTPHGDIWVGFTPDEEIGCGSDRFDLDYFKADYAYTVDGSYEGEIAYENFNAASAVFHVTGKNVHPGSAKDIMINACLIATEIAQMLPADETPATTEGRQGFYHLVHIGGDVNAADAVYIIRDHDGEIFEKRLETLREIEKAMKAKYGEHTVELKIRHSYSNMISVIRQHMHVVEIAEEAIRTAGLEPISTPVRGGTDGARLSFMGLPCPNLGTGGYGFHGPYEHITVEGMEVSVNVLKSIIANPVDR